MSSTEWLNDLKEIGPRIGEERDTKPHRSDISRLGNNFYAPTFQLVNGVINTLDSEAHSQAEELGFRKGDLVCSIEGQLVTSLMELRKILNKLEPKVKWVQVIRGVKRMEFKLA
jgi:hypothetical protein